MLDLGAHLDLGFESEQSALFARGDVDVGLADRIAQRVGDGARVKVGQ